MSDSSAEENDDSSYGFFCDESGHEATDQMFPFSNVLANANMGKSSSDRLSQDLFVDPIEHISRATTPTSSFDSHGSLPQAVQRLRTSTLQGPPSAKSSASELGHNGGDELPEAPVWVVTQGSGAYCGKCRCKLVFRARHSLPGRVFSRSFQSDRESCGSLMPSMDSTTFGSSWSSYSSARSSVQSMPSRFASRCLSFDERPTAVALGGIRVVAGRFGSEWAEFEVVVSAGAAVHRAWRTHEDVALLVDVVGVQRRYRAMPRSNMAWENFQKHKRWFGATKLLHLIEKRTALDVFFENLLYELDSPTQFLNFVDDESGMTGATSAAGAATARAATREAPPTPAEAGTAQGHLATPQTRPRSLS
eukprot:CAMPEP_0172605982 /NCGR_PEP_ID=MMETSP1068-20121228/26171_1 /TAXON_ID=35684 /ORGANISM="Pseudopedinella elastica, Strain CCMP716" /LENGTH=362 /DNA_ID=CAMNT_0013408541 /DNA_START=124 /DNA_END=1213 /DNA_ORIENTATION=-